MAPRNLNTSLVSEFSPMTPNIKKINPEIPKRLVILTNLFTGISVSSTFIILDTSTELKKIATRREDPKTTERVIGKKIMNLPILPGHKPSGMNAAIVVAVEIIIGKAISAIPFFVASSRFIPSFSINL